MTTERPQSNIEVSYTRTEIEAKAGLTRNEVRRFEALGLINLPHTRGRSVQRFSERDLTMLTAASDLIKTRKFKKTKIVEMLLGAEAKDIAQKNKSTDPT